MLGKFKLSPNQVLRLGRGSSNKVSLEEDGGSQAISSSAGPMTSHGFAPFRPQGAYLISSTSDNSLEESHIGQYRVTFEYDTCGSTTIISQQVVNEEGQTTFRKWNPDKIRVPYG
mmetsp:Transcript_20677/g.27905  ORF Transcript_20677/g.27905 Transcript_20677/m.27905 type:complete len:115 (-) Transcript_20677:772-1116(-)